MSIVSLLNVNIQDNPAPFSKPFNLEITFECLEQLSKDLEWKLTYVGSATSSEHDQELDSLLVGPIPVGVNKFVFNADPPNPSRIPSSEILGVTVILLTCAYDSREFIRVGYYVNNEYDNEEMNAEPPKTPQVDRIVRNMLVDKPRVTRFAIKWDSEESAPAEYPPDQPEADQQEADGDQYGADETDVEAEEAEGEVEGEASANAAERDPDAMDEDTDMGGVAHPEEGKEVEEDEEGSEDLEEESSEDEEYDEEGAEGAEGDEEMAVEGEHNAPAPGGPAQVPPVQEVMTH